MPTGDAAAARKATPGCGPFGQVLPDAAPARIICPVYRFLLIAVAALASMPAQADPPVPPPKPILIDTVIATVNDSAIMLSALNTNRAGRLRAMMARYGSLRQDDIERVTREELENLIDRHTMAQAAKTFGVFPPEQVESFLRRELERDERDLVRDFGSQQAYTRALEEQGRTWQTFVSEQRVDKLAGFAEQFSVDMRLQRQSNLFLTPRMLRETYEREHGRFVRPAEAIVGMVVFQGPDAADKAAAAAELWRQEDLTSRELAARCPGAVPLDNALASSLVDDLATWGLAGPLHRVSAPMPRGQAVQLAKIQQYFPARNGRFEDLDVQNELREMCRSGVIEEFKKQALERARQRTEVWRMPGAR
jgi:hypothetical protein